jgi:hypothetical protein
MIPADRAAIAFAEDRAESVPCMCCLMPRSQHRWSTDQCQNVDWWCGNGEPQWLSTTYTWIREVVTV